MLIPQPSARVMCSWDEEFTSYRDHFYAPSENQTPEEYLGDIIGSGGHHGIAGTNSERNVLDTITRFMESSVGYDEGPSSIHQTEVVTAFCENPDSDLSHSKDSHGDERPVALVFEWENKVTRLKQRGGIAKPLTHMQLLARLCAKRFVEPESPSGLPSPDPRGWPEWDSEMDADRRLIYICNPDPLVIAVLAKTTSCLETPVMQRMIFRYLIARTSFEAHIWARGFKNFSLELNISYFCLRKGGSAIDGRITGDGSERLRKTLRSPEDPIDGLSSAGVSYSIYETQLSVAVTGVDHWRWTAWAFVDTWFNPGESVVDYYEGESGGQPDPLADGQMDVNPPERFPREYFLKVFEIRIREVEKEWNYILYMLQQHVQRVGSHSIFTSPQQCFETKKGRDQIRRLASWNTEMRRMVGTLLKSLSRTLVAWDIFQKTDIGCFLYDDVAGTKRPEHLLPSLRIIEKTFLNLHITHEGLEQVQWSLEELARGLARGERNHSSFVQQRTGEHIKLLTWVTIAWSPVVIATGMCSAQAGIFPFRNNIGDFLGAVVVVGCLVGLTIAILLSRHSNLVEWRAISGSGHNNLTDGVPEREMKEEEDEGEKKAGLFSSRLFARHRTGGLGRLSVMGSQSFV